MKKREGMSLQQKIYSIIYPDFCYFVLEDSYLSTFVNSYEQLKKITKIQSSFIAKLLNSDEETIQKESYKFAKYHSTLKIEFLFIFEAINFIEGIIKSNSLNLNVEFGKIDIAFNILKNVVGKVYIKDMLNQALDSIDKNENIINYNLIEKFNRFLDKKDFFTTSFECKIDTYIESLEFKIKSFQEDDLRVKFEMAHNNLHKYIELFISFYKKNEYKEAVVILDDLIKTSYLMFTLLKDIELKWEKYKEKIFANFLIHSFNTQNGFLGVIIEPSINKRVENFINELFTQLKEKMQKFENNFLFLNNERIYIYFSKESEYQFLEALDYFQKSVLEIAEKFKKRYSTLLQYPIFRIGFLELFENGAEDRVIQKVFDLIKNELEEVSSYEVVYFKDFSENIHSLIQKAKEELQLEKNIIDSIKNKEFVLHIQKIVNVNTKETFAVEVLSRLKNAPDVSAEKFVDVVEKNSLTLEMDIAVFEEVYKKMDLIKEKVNRFFINIFPTSLESVEFVDLVKKVVKKARQLGLEMVMELTEHNILKNLEILNEIDVKIAFDDFGSGYTNFERIGKITVSDKKAKVLKIDGEIVKYVQNKAYLNIVKSISFFAKESGLKVIYEFVENEKVYKIIEKIINDFEIEGYIQGFYFSKPEILK